MHPQGETMSNSITVGDFLKAAYGRIPIKIVAGGKALENPIEEPIVNRTGLALTGFFEDFAAKRLQIIGNAEVSYFNSLPAAEQTRRFKALLDHGARMFIVTAGHIPPKRMVNLALKYGAALLATEMQTYDFAMQSSFVAEALAAPRATIYGTMIEVAGLGVLFEGSPGLGKSETALGLIKRGCALIADDLTCIRKDIANNMLYASASKSTAGFMEIRGIGIVDVRKIFGVNAIRGEKRLQLVITFRKLSEIKDKIDRTGRQRLTRSILGVDIPNVVIPVSEGRDLVNLVETAAQQHKLILTGYNPVDVLSSRLRERASEASNLTKRSSTNG